MDDLLLVRVFDCEFVLAGMIFVLGFGGLFSFWAADESDEGRGVGDLYEEEVVEM